MKVLQQRQMLVDIISALGLGLVIFAVAVL